MVYGTVVFYSSPLDLPFRNIGRSLPNGRRVVGRSDRAQNRPCDASHTARPWHMLIGARTMSDSTGSVAVQQEHVQEPAAEPAAHVEEPSEQAPVAGQKVVDRL